MRSAETIGMLWQGLRRRQRAMRARLRRDRAALALLALITIGLGEPLLCIVHCQVWLPIALHGYFSAQHAHQHQHDHAHMAAMAADENAGAALLPDMPQPATPGCAMLGGAGQGSAPPHVPPSPVHDLLPALLLILFVATLVGARPAARPGDPPPIFFRPLLRPPILASA